MKKSIIVLAALCGTLVHAQLVAQLPRVKGAARVKLKMENPWRPAANADRAKKGDYFSPKGTMTVVGFIKNAPKKYIIVPNEIYTRIKKKQIPFRKGNTPTWRYYAYWIKTDAITTVTLIGRSGARAVNVNAIFTKPITQKDVDAVIRMGASARV
ncbi:MAG: hypothetical protein JNJ45_04015 [Chthonomonas sp.]|nr:hypothetical protein [Chthonomonas sp.]